MNSINTKRPKHGVGGLFISDYDEPKKRVNIALTQTAINLLDSLVKEGSANSRSDLIEKFARGELNLCTITKNKSVVKDDYPITQSENGSSAQPITQSENAPIAQPITQSENGSSAQPITQSENAPIAQPSRIPIPPKSRTQLSGTKLQLAKKHLKDKVGRKKSHTTKNLAIFIAEALNDGLTMLQIRTILRTNGVSILLHTEKGKTIKKVDWMKIELENIIAP